MTRNETVPEEPVLVSVASEDSVGHFGEPPLDSGWLRIHFWPIVGLIALFAAGMSYSLFWFPVVHHLPYWVTSGDLWATFRDAHYVIWDGEGRIYGASTSFVTFPGIAVLLSPFAWLQEALHLSDSWPVFFPRPTGWFVLGPIDMLCGGVLLFPLDALARRFSLSSTRRAVATLLEVVLIFPTVAFWGHPEDSLALALGLYALLAAYDRRWLHSAAFFALAVVFQPLILLIVPIALSYVPAKKWPAFGTVMAIPTAALLIPPLIQEWGPTTYAIFKQPNFPRVDHPTPWMSLAPVLTRARWATGLTIHYSPEKHKYVYGPVRGFIGETVSAGPGRTIAIVLACLVGVWVAHRKPPLAEVVWWAAFSLALRCVFESVMDPYYVVPSLVLVVVLALTVGKIRFLLTLAAAAVCTKTSYWHTGEWRYYLFVTVSLLAALAFSWPGRLTQSRRLQEKERAATPVS
jgi:hypothetical protein